MKTEYLLGIGLLLAFGAAYAYQNYEPKISNRKYEGNKITFTFRGKQFTHIMGKQSNFTEGRFAINVKDWNGNYEISVSKDGKFLYSISGGVYSIDPANLHIMND